MGQAASGRIRELDGWRGISILLVVVGHEVIFVLDGSIGKIKLLAHLAGAGSALGVNIFFVISGFVITRLLIREETQRRAVSLRGFYTRRFFRILPVFYLVLSVICLLSWLGWTPVSSVGVAVAALFLRDVAHPVRYWFLGHAWSLAVEEQFYLIFPLFWVAMSPRKRPGLLLATFFLFLLWGAFSFSGPLSNVLTAGAIIGFSCINAGALLAVFGDRARSVAARAHPAAFFLTIVLLFSHPTSQGRAAETLYNLFLPFGIAYALMFTVSRKSWVSSLLKKGAIQWMGLISYSAYLWQQLFVGSVADYGSPGVAKAFHLALPLLFVVSALSFYWIERPCTRFGRQLSARLAAREEHVAVS